MSIVSSARTLHRTLGPKLSVAPILLFALLMTAALTAQERAPSRTRQLALKGCLSATSQGRYQLADDETGTLYTLIGGPESLRMLVGNDVLVGGYNLESREYKGEEKGSGNDPRAPLSGSDGSPVAGHGQSGSEARTANSFRVVNAVKVSDLCILSTMVSVTSVASPAR